MEGGTSKLALSVAALMIAAVSSASRSSFAKWRKDIADQHVEAGTRAGNFIDSADPGMRASIARPPPSARD
jgi:hypothetical protein